MRCLCGAKMEKLGRGGFSWELVPGFRLWRRHWCTKGHAVRGSLHKTGARMYEVVAGSRITAWPIGFSLVIWDEETL